MPVAIAVFINDYPDILIQPFTVDKPGNRHHKFAHQLCVFWNRGGIERLNADSEKPFFFCLFTIFVDNADFCSVGADRQKTVRGGGYSIRKFESIFTLLYQNVSGTNHLAVYGKGDFSQRAL
ncbi:MAG: hypothetical protein ACD_39C01772G0002 [uncultured bacterium]|nr:MAG: hypothetical protein ACD_39C01772G0002 [uncultured bacterium]